MGTLPAALFAETLRRAHCAHAKAGDLAHACIGRCTITPAGTEFDCKACGTGGDPLAPHEFEARGARAVVEAIGLAWASLTPEAQRAAVTAYDRAKGGK